MSLVKDALSFLSDLKLYQKTRRSSIDSFNLSMRYQEIINESFEEIQKANHTNDKEWEITAQTVNSIIITSYTLDSVVRMIRSENKLDIIKAFYDNAEELICLICPVILCKNCKDIETAISRNKEICEQIRWSLNFREAKRGTLSELYVSLTWMTLTLRRLHDISHEKYLVESSNGSDLIRVLEFLNGDLSCNLWDLDNPKLSELSETINTYITPTKGRGLQILSRNELIAQNLYPTIEHLYRLFLYFYNYYKCGFVTKDVSGYLEMLCFFVHNFFELVCDTYHGNDQFTIFRLKSRIKNVEELESSEKMQFFLTDDASDIDSVRKEIIEITGKMDCMVYAIMTMKNAWPDGDESGEVPESEEIL